MTKDDLQLMISHQADEIEKLKSQLNECHGLILNAYISVDRLNSYTLDQVLDLNDEIRRGVYFYPILKHCGISDERMKKKISERWHEQINKRKDIEIHGNVGRNQESQ